MKNQILKLWNLINSSNKILLLTHKRMDPDTFWSMWALYFVLEKIWKNIKATNDDPTPINFEFLWANQLIEEDLNVKKYNPDLIISLDAWSIHQLWNSYMENQEIIKNTTFVNIDHHITNDSYWDLAIIDKESSSTCELLFEILKILDYKKYIDKKSASLLISGILSDTNIYYNTNTSSKTLKIAWELLELWADMRTSIYNFFKKRTYEKSRLWWECLKDLKKSDNWKIVWLTIKREKFEKTWTTDRETAWLIWEFLANVEWVDVCFILYELENMDVKASFRSKNFDVSEFTKLFWWWWHKYAAWFTLSWKIEDIEGYILNWLEEKI